MQYKIMTFNLLYGGHEKESVSLENRKPRMLEVIRSELPDMIGCQEALGDTRRWLERNLSDLYAMVGCGRSPECRGESVPAFYRKDRFALLSLETFWLSETPDIPGSLLTGSDQSPCPRLAHILHLRDLETKQPIRWLNTHLDCGGGESRAWEMNYIRERIGIIKEEEAFFLTGDLNLRPEEAPIQAFLKQTQRMGVRDATAAIPGTFHGFGVCDPPIKIDYIFSNGETIFANIIPDEHPNGVWYSDHYAVCAEIEPRRNI